MNLRQELTADRGLRPKAEIRSPKDARSPKAEEQYRAVVERLSRPQHSPCATSVFGFRSSDFFRISAFGLRASRQGSVLIIVLWIAFGLISLALYFADSMNFELRASDNRVSAQAADQAIEGAARYVIQVLATQAAHGSNGFIPDPTGYRCDAVPVGDAHFWLIGRDTNIVTGPGKVCFGLVDEASKLNLNSVISNQLVSLPRMTVDLTQAILDWRNTNSTGPTVTYYPMQQPSYICKNDPFETVDELRLLYGADMDILIGEDGNRNGVLDPNETDENQNGMLDPGIFEYMTVYSREPNTNSDGSARINITNLSPTSSDYRRLSSLLTTNFGARGRTILTAVTRTPLHSPLEFDVRSGLSDADFMRIATNLTTVTGPFIEGRVNINTASQTVLTCLFGGDSTAAQTVISYRQANPTGLTSILWIKAALGQSFPTALQLVEAGDYITVQSYQFCADVAATGPYGRGYRRVKFILDTTSGSPQILYRQDLTHLGWGLGSDLRRKLQTDPQLASR